MKKIIFCVVLAVILFFISFFFSSCNKSIGLGNYTFNGIHVSLPGVNGGKCLTVKNWHDNETGIEVKTKECGSIFCSEGTYILFENICPICGREID